jgi:hypothetical protein
MGCLDKVEIENLREKFFKNFLFMNIKMNCNRLMIPLSVPILIGL